MCSITMDVFAELADAPDDEVADAIDQLAAVECAARRQLLRLVHEYGARGAHRLDGCHDMAMWLCVRLDVAPGMARQLVEVADALEQLPRVAAAFESGRLAWDQLVLVRGFADPSTDQEP